MGSAAARHRRLLGEAFVLGEAPEHVCEAEPADESMLAPTFLGDLPLHRVGREVDVEDESRHRAQLILALRIGTRYGDRPHT
jgi:hypothetical protein